MNSFRNVGLDLKSSHLTFMTSYLKTFLLIRKQPEGISFSHSFEPWKRSSPKAVFKIGKTVSLVLFTILMALKSAFCPKAIVVVTMEVSEAVYMLKRVMPNNIHNTAMILAGIDRGDLSP